MLSNTYGTNNALYDEAKAIIAATPPEDYPEIEAKLTAMLRSPGASAACKTQVCLLLRLCGGRESVAALAELLTDAKLSDPARLALQDNPSAEAAAALRKALPRTSGTIAAGIIESLGQRRDNKAAQLLRQYASSGNSPLAVPAITALGNIGTPLAMAKLLSIPDGLKKPAVAEALLANAAHTAKDGTPKRAASIYRMLFSQQQPQHIRIAALQGLTQTLGKSALPQIADALAGDDPQLQKQAFVLLRTLPAGKDTTLAITHIIPQLPAETAAGVIDILAERNDPAATRAIIKAAKTGRNPARATALKALAAIETTGSLNALIDNLKPDQPFRKIAAESLKQSAAPNLDRLLADRFKRNDDDTLRTSLIQVIYARNSAPGNPAILQLLSDKSPLIRIAAAGALAACGSPEQPAAQAERTVTAELSSADPAVRRAAVLALCNWPTASPADTLLKFASTEITPALKEMAQEGAANLKRRHSTKDRN